MLVVGTAWYWLVEEFTPLDAAFMAVTTVTTVGYREVQPLDVSGRLFTIVFIFVGVGIVFYTVVAVAEAVLVGEIAEALGIRRLNRKVRAMEQHFVVCGFGRVGQEVAQELEARHVAFVIIDRAQERQALARARGYLAVAGDATEEAVLREAGVERARVLITASDSDAGNTFVVLTAKALNPALFIIARAGSESAERRLRTAGADRVVSPYQIAGRRMAVTAVQPLLLDFLEAPPERADGATSIVAELVVAAADDGLVGRTLGELLTQCASVRVLGIERVSGELTVGPPATEVMRVGDRVMLFGSEAEIERLSAGPVRGGAR